MRTGPFARFFLAAALLAAATVHASVTEIRWDERGGAALRTQVAPGKFAQWCGALRTREVVNWEFEAAEPLDMNIHFHDARIVRYPVQRESVRLWRGTLQAALDQQYCWMWSNRGATPVALQARLQKPLAAR